MNLTAQYEVAGKISDETGNPLPGANIYIPELQIGISADKKGNYVISNVRPGKYKLQFSYIGYET
ncbi:MAG: carboxypeptidase-like regulatory domain-containing protein, partial [Bacteroidales bacterium]|nr:carboxypeptidase-like regulatory domain-containing protein [Bacteroidales bacterium]